VLPIVPLLQRLHIVLPTRVLVHIVLRFFPCHTVAFILNLRLLLLLLRVLVLLPYYVLATRIVVLAIVVLIGHDHLRCVHRRRWWMMRILAGVQSRGNTTRRGTPRIV
jgi:hypothetical protein